MSETPDYDARVASHFPATWSVDRIEALGPFARWTVTHPEGKFMVWADGRDPHFWRLCLALDPDAVEGDDGPAPD